jgi:hypothetical protein
VALVEREQDVNRLIDHIRGAGEGKKNGISEEKRWHDIARYAGRRPIYSSFIRNLLIM